MGKAETVNPFAVWKKADQVTPAGAYDRNGRVLHEGDIVHLMGKADIMWQVRRVAPVLNPSMPKGLVELHLVAAFVVPVPGGQPLGDVIKCRDVSEQPAVGASNGDDGLHATRQEADETPEPESREPRGGIIE